MQTYCSSPSEEFPHTGKPKLLIIELDYHAEVLTTLCPILAQRFDLVLWTTDKIWHKTCLPEQLFATTLIMPKKHSVRRFWQRHQNILSKVDLIYFNTLEKHFAFFARLNFACPTIMRIHNTNASLFPAESIDWSAGNLGKIASHLLTHVLAQRIWHYKKMLYRKMDLLMLPSEGVAARLGAKIHAQKIDNISPYNPPFSAPGNTQPAPPEDTIMFAVTGSVDASRKDYEVLQQAIQRLKQRKPDQNLVMVFLGWAKGARAQKILDLFTPLQDRHFRFEYFRDYVPQKICEQYMAKIHFLVAPLRLRAHHKIYQEVYGTTKVSGIENDALRYRKPFILPRDYTLPRDLTRVALTYDGADSLCDAMVSMMENSRWKTLTDEYQNLVSYESGNMAADFYQLYLQLQSARRSSAVAITTS
jgi:hypothetical protein